MKDYLGNTTKNIIFAYTLLYLNKYKASQKKHENINKDHNINIYILSIHVIFVCTRL